VTSIVLLTIAASYSAASLLVCSFAALANNTTAVDADSTSTSGNV
jgi:hypothetical protein